MVTINCAAVAQNLLESELFGHLRGAFTDARTDRILGFTMFGPEAGEVLAVVQTAMLAVMAYTGLRDAILAHEEQITGYGVDRLSRLPGVKLVGAGHRRLGILSLDVQGIHPHDLATVLDQHHVAVRAGHHCAQPLMDRLGLPGTTRASLGVYNDESDIDALATALTAAQKMFG